MINRLVKAASQREMCEGGREVINGVVKTIAK